MACKYIGKMYGYFTHRIGKNWQVVFSSTVIIAPLLYLASTKEQIIQNWGIESSHICQVNNGFYEVVVHLNFF